MTQSRLLLVILIVLGLIFALGIGIGASNNEKPPDTDSENDIKKSVDQFLSKPWSKLLTNALNPLIPQLLPSEMTKKNSTTPLTNKRLHQINMGTTLVLKILPLSEEAWIPVRQAAMMRKRGTVKILFQSLRAETESLRTQCIPSKKDCSNAQPNRKWNEETLTIPKEGGTLSLICADDSSCRVALTET